ncbi:MAG: hypothetical protein ACYS0F_11525 [Planctomycetota bacterium]|jgi:hypothetical protein
MLLPLAVLFFLLGVAPRLSRWLLNRFGVARLVLIVFSAWPIATVWYACKLDSMDRHFVDRWSWGTRNAFILTTVFCLLMLAPGLLSRWAKSPERTPADLGRTMLQGVAFALGILLLAAAAFAVSAAFIDGCTQPSP